MYSYVWGGYKSINLYRFNIRNLLSENLKIKNFRIKKLSLIIFILIGISIKIFFYLYISIRYNYYKMIILKNVQFDFNIEFFNFYQLFDKNYYYWQINLFNSSLLYESQMFMFTLMCALKNKSITRTVISDELHPLITSVKENFMCYTLFLFHT